MSHDDQTYEKDESHPIPDVDVCDVELRLKEGGGKLVLVIASPMRNDPRSRSRLLRKMENYLRYVTSDEFEQRYGGPQTSRIIAVHFHPDTDPAARRLIADCKPWVEDNGAAFEMCLL